MAKPTGFMEYSRKTPADRLPAERLRDWGEFHARFTEDEARCQAARCMDCGTPFCHSCVIYEGAASGCPLNNLIPEWNDLAYRGLWGDALNRLRMTNNFPEFTSRVCPAPCEGACTLAAYGDPVTIKCNEAAITERGWIEGAFVPEMPPRRTRKMVAVIGSGPAGLACADQLNQAGHEVTVFERAERPGGILTYGIPNMKLDKGVVQRRVDLMAAEGVRFVTGIEVGIDLSAAELRSRFDAIVVACGSTRPRDLDVPGRKLEGIHFALEYLGGTTRNLIETSFFDHGPLTASGRNVVVIGGGDTGGDCVGTALRQGCAQVTQLEILPRPPESRAQDNPWPRWPRILRHDYGQEESIERFGCDPRLYAVSPKRFEADGGGRVSAVVVVDVEWKKGAGGRAAPRELPGSERRIPAELVLLAMGFAGPEKTLPEALGLALDERGSIAATYGRFATGVEGVFAAGDARRGQSLVVWAIAEGRGAAREVDRYLMGETSLA